MADVCWRLWVRYQTPVVVMVSRGRFGWHHASHLGHVALANRAAVVTFTAIMARGQQQHIVTHRTKRVENVCSTGAVGPDKMVPVMSTLCLFHVQRYGQPAYMLERVMLPHKPRSQFGGPQDWALDLTYDSESGKVTFDAGISGAQSTSRTARALPMSSGGPLRSSQ